MYKYFSVIGMSLCLMACSGSNKDIEAFIKDPGVKPGKVEALPKVIFAPIVKYDRSQLPDPFAARSLTVTKGKDAPDLDRPREVLEKFGLDSLRMVGYVVSNNTAYALIMDPEGAVHKLHAGNYLGTNYGKIDLITKEGMNITESIADNSGGWSTREVNLSYNELEQLNTSGLSNKNTTKAANTK